MRSISIECTHVRETGDCSRRVRVQRREEEKGEGPLKKLKNNQGRMGRTRG